MFQLDTVKLRALLFDKKISAAKLAETANLTAKTVSKIIKGGRANAMTIGKLADALNCDALNCDGEELLKEEM